jgi:hypothetical protein
MLESILNIAKNNPYKVNQNKLLSLILNKLSGV